MKDAIHQIALPAHVRGRSFSPGRRVPYTNKDAQGVVPYHIRSFWLRRIFCVSHIALEAIIG